MITHQEAEILTSARQDAPLDALVERELQAHLATCDQCRAFAAATERLTAGMRTMPGIAANPRIKRDVMNRVRAGRGPLAGIFGGFGAGFHPGPALAAVALVAVIGLFGWLALDRLFLENGGEGTNQIAAVPTAQVTRENADPASSPGPTEVLALATDTATEAPVPSATTAPQPTETPVPTEPPAPTATTTPEPTVTAELPPTATTEPTEAPQDPTVAPASEDGPVDLTGDSVPTAEPTSQPTATDVPPTATDVPTVQPTATEVPPTATAEPTATAVPPTATVVPTIEPTATDVPPTQTEAPLPEPTPTPAIEPMDGATSEPVDAGESANILGIGSADDDAEIPTTPPESGGDGQIEGDEATESATEDVGGSSEEPASIELIDPDGGTSEADTTPATETAMMERAASGPETIQPLADVSERYTGIAGDPAGDLGLTREGRLEFVSVPDGASMTTAEGYRLQMPASQPGVVQVCGDGFCEPGTGSPDAEGWQGDVPLGVIDNTVYMLRLYADRSEVYSLQSQGTQLVDGTVIATVGPTSAPAAVYESSDSLYAWLPEGQWLQVSGSSAQALSGTFADPANVRFAPSAESGPLVGYFSEGLLVIAPVSAPDAAVLTLPASGSDFDISPPGDRIAVIRGADIVIYDLQGNELEMYEGGDLQPRSLIWLRGGIVWVDAVSGALYQIPQTAP